MEEVTKIKFRHIFFPLVVVLMLFGGGYTFLHWYIFLREYSPMVDNEILCVVFPILSAGLTILFYFRKKLRILTDKEEFMVRSSRRKMMGLSFLVITAPTIIAQFYIATVTGKLTVLNDISEIKNAPSSRYYRLNHFYIPKSQFIIRSFSTLTGKQRDLLDLNVFALVPIFSGVTSDSTIAPKAWYGLHFEKEWSDRVTEVEKTAYENEFFNKTMNRVKNFDMTDFSFLESTAQNIDHKSFVNVLNANGITQNENAILIPRKGQFEARNGNKLAWLIVVTIGSLCIYAFALWLADEDPAEIRKLKRRA